MIAPGLTLQEAHDFDGRRLLHGAGLLQMYHPGRLPASSSYARVTNAAVEYQAAQLLAQTGLTAEIGTEMEFVLYPKTAGPNANAWITARGDIRRLFPVDSFEHIVIGGFDAREVLMYTLLHLDGRTRNILEPLGVTEYFDGWAVLELQLKHTEPVQQQRNLDTLCEAVVEHARAFGLTFHGAADPTFHINYSLHDQAGNLMAVEHPKFMTTTPFAAAGLLRAIYDHYPLQMSNFDFSHSLHDRCELGVDRTAEVRFCRKRLEVRARMGRYPVDPVVFMALGLAGLRFGVTAQERGETLSADGYLAPVTPVDKLSANAGPKNWVRTVLNGSTINNRATHGLHTLAVPDRYITWAAHPIASDLGVSDIDERNSGAIYAVGLTEFFRRVRVQDDAAAPGGLRVIWPRTNGSKYFFTTQDGAHHHIDIDLLAPEFPTATSHTALVSSGFANGSRQTTPNRVMHERVQRAKASPIGRELGVLNTKLIASHRRQMREVETLLTRPLRDEPAPNAGLEGYLADVARMAMEPELPDSHRRMRVAESDGGHSFR